MKKLLHTIWGLGGGGVLATSSWFIYDAADPTLIRVYRDSWNPLPLTIKKSLTSATETPYSGSSCFERFFGKIEIQNFNKTPTSAGSTSSETKKFESLFKDTNSDIYGCAVGEGSGFYELVIRNEKTGFATWFDSNQRSFVLEKKEDNKWEIKAGVWATGTPTSNIEQIKNKTGNWSWWFYMPKDQISGNMQSWNSVFQSPSAVYEKDTGWKNTSTSFAATGQIPKFDKVETLTNFCETQSYVRKSRETGISKEKLDVYCLTKQP